MVFYFHELSKTDPRFMLIGRGPEEVVLACKLLHHRGFKDSDKQLVPRDLKQLIRADSGVIYLPQEEEVQDSSSMFQEVKYHGLSVMLYPRMVRELIEANKGNWEGYGLGKSIVVRSHDDAGPIVYAFPERFMKRLPFDELARRLEVGASPEEVLEKRLERAFFADGAK